MQAIAKALAVTAATAFTLESQSLETSSLAQLDGAGTI